MRNLALQIERSAAYTAAAGAPVVFDNVVYTNGKISCDTGTGVVTFYEPGRYIVDWRVTAQAAASPTGFIFAISTSQGDFLEGNTSNRIDEEIGTGIVDVTVAPVTMSLINASTSDVALASSLPGKATLRIVKDDIGAGAAGADGAADTKGPTGPIGLFSPSEGFSAFISPSTASESTQSAGSAVVSPYFDSAASDEITGNGTVPVSGVYIAGASAHYTADFPVTASLASGVNPTFAASKDLATIKDVALIFNPSATSEGFSAFISSITAAASTQLTGWTVTSPYFSNTTFNETTGDYTVPTSGVYIIGAAVNYSTTGAITTSLGGAINPTFVARRTSPTVTDLVTGLFPLLDVDIALVLTLRAILANGVVTLAGEADLTAGDVIGLFYEADGLTVTLDLGGSGAEGIVWSINRLTLPTS